MKMAWSTDPRWRMCGMQVLIIDEISMIEAHQFERLDQVGGGRSRRSEGCKSSSRVTSTSSRP